jgi:uncharacterized protein (UPF0548 family)
VPGAPVTHDEVGATRERASVPSTGYGVLSVRRELHGPDAFDRAADFVLGFGMQRGCGFEVDAGSSVAHEGLEVTLTARFGPLRIVAPTRVVYVLDEPDRRGFAYGTLPGHPESGEELFLVERQGDAVYAEVRAFSRPGRWFTRLAGPLGRRLQHLASVRYLRACAEAVASA